MAFNNAVNAKQQGTQYLSTTGTWTGVDGGSAGNVLTSNGTGVAPSFQAASAGTYYSLTPYIVGADVHSQFTTITAAIAQAVTDGASATTPANIYIKPGVYTENPALADGINLIGFSSDARVAGSHFSQPPPSPTTRPVVRITGQLTYSPTTGADSAASVTNITVHPTASNTHAVIFTADPAGLGTDYFSMNNCEMISTGTGSGLNLASGGNPNTYINNCYLNKLLDNSNGIFAANLCFVNGVSALNDSLGRVFNFCTLVGAVTIVNTNGPTEFYNCQLQSTISVGAGAGFAIYDCQLKGALTSSTLVNYGNVSFLGDAGIASASGGCVGLNQQFGNTILQQTRAGSGTTSISNQDFYIGNNNTAVGTFSLPNTSVAQGQVFILKDEAGNAGTNNLTLNVTGGVKTIDGAASKTITTNYGVLRVMYDGTNYFTW